MTETRKKLSVKARFSGQGLADTLKREKAEAQKRQRLEKETARKATEAQAEVTTSSGAEDAERTPQQMAARLYRAFAGQMDQLEARLHELFETSGETGSGLQEIDKTVKTLASLAKTLSALMDLKTGTEPDAEDQNFDDREELRAALAHRLERLCEEGPD